MISIQNIRLKTFGLILAGCAFCGLTEAAEKNGTTTTKVSKQVSFNNDVLYREAGTVGRVYGGWSWLPPSVTNLKEGDVTYGKVSGPDWLKVADWGGLSGVPGENDLGLNEFVVELKDTKGRTDTAKLRLQVQAADTAYRIGRIAVSSDGNHHDPDDWGATTASIGILAASGLKDHLVLYVYSDHVWGSSEAGAEAMIKSAIGGAEAFGFDTNRFMAGVDDPERAYNALRDQIVMSTKSDPLVVVCAGPMQVAGEALARAKAENPAALKHVRFISHSTWNNEHADKPAKIEDAHTGWTWKEMINTYTDDGVIFDKIQDQNDKKLADKGLSTGSAGPDGKHLWETWYFLRDYDQHDDATNAAIQLIWERMKDSRKADISDAGMIYYLVTGDMAGNPAKLEVLFDNGF